VREFWQARDMTWPVAGERRVGSFNQRLPTLFRPLLLDFLYGL
jgi:hypothetical protein